MQSGAQEVAMLTRKLAEGSARLMVDGDGLNVAKLRR
jgi:hypothetical protein